MTGDIAIFSSGLWRLRDEVACLSGLSPRRVLWRAPSTATAIVGWGHKPTAAKARAEARRTGLPYIAVEDGFLRSLRAGPTEKPLAMIADRAGIYYDARQPSGLETILQDGGISAPECERATALLAEIARLRLSKYNDGADDPASLGLDPARPLVLLVDQTHGDESVAGGLANAGQFAAMLVAAIAENPDAQIVVKLHPETVVGAKRGYLSEMALPPQVKTLAAAINPWALLDRRPAVYTVTSQLGFEALMAGCKVVCFGVPFYAGWGLTDDRLAAPRRTARPARAALAAAVYLRYCSYFDIWRRSPISAETAVDQLAFRRSQFLRNRQPVIAYRIARWKRRAVAAMLDGPAGPPVFVNGEARAMALARDRGGIVAAWGREALRWRDSHPDSPCLAVEDGFIRSAGLGAAFVPPLSLVFDASGLYFDPRRTSDLEQLLATASFTPEKLAEARRLKDRLAAERVTKYNLADAAPVTVAAAGRPVVVVPGQVADDWAVRLGVPGAARGENVNLTLLAAVRARHPDGFVIFKPHPDVERLGRAGALQAADESRLADQVVRHASMEQVLRLADRIETYSSLTGFEALLRGIAVTAHGLPFYAGWGLTEDLTHSPRRGRRRSLEELVAAALIDYPRYWDPVSGFACPPDVVLDRLMAMRRQTPGMAQRLGMLAGRAVIAWRRIASRL